MNMFILYASEIASAPSLDLDFTGGSLPSGASFARASTATYFDGSGVLRTAANDAARFDYDPVALTLKGLLIEPQAINYLQQSQAFATSPWNPDSSDGTPVITQNYAPAPDGTTTATRLQCSASSYQGFEQGIVSSGLGDSETNTASFYVKSNTGVSQTAQIKMTQYMVADHFQSVTIPATWTKVSDTALFGSGGNGFWTGFVTNGTELDILIWGAQQEVASKGTSYIPTTSAAATRAADALSFTIPSGIGNLIYTFDDNSTQTVAVSAGAYTVPTNLNRAWIKRIASV
ncbi:MAG: hypothetical protein P4M13_02845 [Alphaproteobacteria bacterium]|nr:hypothetical protein [Alphaproteobacteria bacterium]